MAKRGRKFVDDGWAVWVDGDDTSTVYLHNWINTKGNSFVDLAIRIRGVDCGRALNIYIPFDVASEEIDDISLHFDDTKILQAIFSAACIVDYQKNAHTSEIAYNGKTVDIVHVSTLNYQTTALSEGTLLRIDLEKLHPFLDNTEAYFIWRMPHKSLNAIFRSRVYSGNTLERLRDLITTPVVSEHFGYSVRINESRLLPEEITRIGAFHRQKLQKAVITVSIDESYELNDSGCYRIRRMEEKLYQDYMPKGYRCEDAIAYQWFQTRDDNMQGQFNFYFGVSKDSISRASMSLYLVLLLLISVFGDTIASLFCGLLGIE